MSINRTPSNLDTMCKRMQDKCCDDTLLPYYLGGGCYAIGGDFGTFQLRPFVKYFELLAFEYPSPIEFPCSGQISKLWFSNDTLESWQQEIVARLSSSWAQSSPCPLSIFRICISLIPVTGDNKFWLVHRTFLKPAEVRAAEQQMRATLNIWLGVKYKFERYWWLVM